MSGSPSGNFFEDFRVSQVLEHAPARTVTEGDCALYAALYGSRFAAHSSAEIARAIGLAAAPLDDLLVFHFVFGKSVQEISLNAVANLGYADCRFLKPVFAGDTLAARTKILGLRENANRETGVVYARTSGFNQRGEEVLTFARWVMVRKRDKAAAPPPEEVPALPGSVSPEALTVFPERRMSAAWATLGAPARPFRDYSVGERLDHLQGVTVEEAEHMMATRLYHNTARVHFNAHAEKSGRFGRRIVYGGHVISIARALSFNGLESALFVAGINAGRHTSPCFAGDTVYAWSEVLEKKESSRPGWGLMRLRTAAVKDRTCEDFPLKLPDGAYDPSVLLDLDYWVVVPGA